MNISDLPKQIISSDGKYKGKPTGSARCCQMESCRGVRIGVRWEDGKLTYPCTANMEFKPNGTAKML